ncbi:hypothetical protein GC176_03200 [bacterium]|nr:hypothetical protein [bacterium]
MRHLSWLAVAAALLAGGCQSPCGGGVCSSTGSPFFPPLPCFFGTAIKSSQTGACDDGECVASGYLTFAKYWPALDGWATEMTAKKCAKKELLRRQWEAKTYLPQDYKRGYTQAFIDVANGESGEVPAVPPPRYWNTAYRSERGRKAADCWFDGYRTGAADAAIKLASLRQIASSGDWTAGGASNDFVQANPAGPPLPTPLPMSPANPLLPQTIHPLPQPGPTQPLVPMPWPNPSAAMSPPFPQNPIRQTPPPAFPPAPRPTQLQPGSVIGNGSTGAVGTFAPAASGTNAVAQPGYAAPAASSPPPAPAIRPDLAAPSIAVPSPSPAMGPAPGYAAPAATSPGGGLPNPLTRQQPTRPPGLPNDPPVWRPRPGHSAIPQQ